MFRPWSRRSCSLGTTKILLFMETTYRLDEAARVVFEEAVGGIQIIQILMKIFCAASCATLMWTQIQKITNIFSLLIQNFLSIFFFI